MKTRRRVGGTVLGVGGVETGRPWLRVDVHTGTTYPIAAPGTDLARTTRSWAA